MKIMNSYFKLVKSYPDSPAVGTIVRASMNEYYKYQPAIWLEYWEECQIGDVILLSKDGYEIKDGEEAYTISEKGEVKSLIITSYHYGKETNYYKVLKNAEKAAIFNIEIKIENEIIVGEDIMLYGVLMPDCKQQEDILSSVLFYKCKRCESWKFFKTTKERDDYIFVNKVIFNFSDLVNLRSKLQSLTYHEFEKHIKDNYVNRDMHTV